MDYDSIMDQFLKLLPTLVTWNYGKIGTRLKDPKIILSLIINNMMRPLIVSLSGA